MYPQKGTGEIRESPVHLQQLSALVGVADNGTFSAAAEALGTVQSNVSAHVARLEDELGATLVDRAAGHLTEEGQVVASHARRVAEELDAIVSELAGLRHEVVGTARVGMIGTTARWLAPALMDLAGERHPGLHLVAVEGTTHSLVPQLRAGQLDLAVLTLPVGEQDLVASPLFEEDLALVVAAGDPLASRRDLQLSDLAGLRLLLPLQGTVFRDEIEAALRPAGISLTPRAEMDGVRLIATLTFEGKGPSILPASAVPGYIRDRWRLLPVAGLPRRRIAVATRKRGLLSTSARALVEMLRELVARPGSVPEGIHLKAPSSRHGG